MSRQGKSKRALWRSRRRVSLEASGAEALRAVYEAFYKNRPLLVLPADIEKREFAFQPWGSSSYVRHLSFSSLEDVYGYIASTIPLHAYYSLARYQYPDAPSMEEKGFEGAPLMFDIDADHFEGCNTQIVTDSCITRASEAADRLIRIVKRDLGAHSWSLYFTGHRGFHIIVDCAGCDLLGREERRAIAYYVAAYDVSLDSLFPLGSGREPATPTPRDPGLRGWLGALIAERSRGQPPVRLRDALGASVREALERLIAQIGIPIDLQVTQDTSRLLRIPGSLNGKTGLRVTPIQDPQRFRPTRRLSPLRGEASIVARDNVYVDSFLGDPLKLEKGRRYRVPAAVGVALASKGLADLVEVVADVELDPGWGTL